MLASLEAAFLAAGLPVPLKLAGSVLAMIKRHWTNDGRLEPEYEQEKALQLVEQAIEPLAGAHLEHADDLDTLKQGQDQIVTLILRVLREIEARASERVEVVLFEGPRRAPAKPVPFFRGRDNELAELEQMLLDNRTVCVVATGIGGIGKTILTEEFVATRAPELFPDGVAWLDGRELIAELGRVARRFGWAGEREATPTEALSLLGQQLHTRRFLLVVDNFDPTKGDPDHVPSPGGQCRTVVTSRSRPLAGRLVGGQLELGVWDLDTCCEYLRERCPRLQSESDRDLDRLAEFVGRLPLGVRLLISVLNNRRSLGAAGVLKLLEQQPLGVLDKYEANGGIAATFQASYEALTDLGRRVLQALGVCAKQTRAEVVGTVANVDDVGEVLDDLHACGLAEFVSDTGAIAPWGLHDVVRMFVLEQATSKEFDSAHEAWVNKHLEDYADPTAHREFTTGVDEAWALFGRLIVRDPGGADAVYRSLAKHLMVVGRKPEAITLSELMLAATVPDSEPAAYALNNLGLCYETLGEVRKAIDLRERAFALYQKLGRLENQANQLNNLGACYQKLGELRKAIDLHERALALYQKLGHLKGQSAALGNLGTCHQALGEVRRAIELHERGLSIDEGLGDLQAQARQLGNLGVCYWTLGEIRKAIEVQERALSLHEKVGSLGGQANQLGNLGACYQNLGDFRKAIDLHERALALCEKLGRLDGLASQLGNLGVCYRTLGDVRRAIDLHERALAIEEKVGDLEGQANQLGNQGLCYADMGDIPKAVDLLERSLAINQKIGSLEGQATDLANLGFIAIEHRPKRAPHYLALARDTFRRMGLPEDHDAIQRITKALVRCNGGIRRRRRMRTSRIP